MPMNYRVWLTSWNCNNRKLSNNDAVMQAWFRDARAYDPDIIVIGQQEGNDTAWNRLNAAGLPNYRKVNHSTLDGFAGGAYIHQYLTVMVRQTIPRAEVDTVAAKRKHMGKGINVLGQNKGGCLSVVSVGQANILFITCHLESKDNTNTVRARQIRDLVAAGRALCVNEAGAEPNAIFMMGDFNYRLEHGSRNGPVRWTNRNLAEMIVYDRESLYLKDTFKDPTNVLCPFHNIQGVGPWVFPEPRLNGQLWPLTYKWNPREPNPMNYERTLAPPAGYLPGCNWQNDNHRQDLNYRAHVKRAYDTCIKFKDKDPGLDAPAEGKRAGEYDIGWLDRIGYCANIQNPLSSVDHVSFRPCNLISHEFLNASDHMAICMRATLRVLV